jgi:hypothetical protein
MNHDGNVLNGSSSASAEAMVSEHQKRPSANGYADDHVLESLSTGAQ